MSKLRGRIKQMESGFKKLTEREQRGLHPGRLGQRIHGAPVIDPEALAGRRERIVVSVAGAGARREIRHALAAMQFVERRDFVCAA